jgi:tetratricopeptide (TPR) repeat protein
MLGIAVAAALAALAVVLARRQQRALFWLLLAGLTWGLVSNLVVVSWVLFAERLLYLPSAGFCVLVALAIDALGARMRSRFAVAAVVAAIATLWMHDAWHDHRVWRSDLTLARAMVAGSPRSAHAHHVLGRVYARAGRLGDALHEFERAMALAPGSFDGFYDAALVHRARGQHAEARRLLRRLLRAFPSYSPAAMALAATEMDLGHPTRALSVADHALWYAPNSAELQVERGLALDAVGRPDDARIAFQRALRLAPGMPSARLGLARLAARDSLS